MNIIESMLEVQIDFNNSHWFFPTIVCVVLLMLLLAIVVTRRRQIALALSQQPFWPAGIDKLRFFGTLILTVGYFAALQPVGDRFPNTGLGFLICSIPFLFLLGCLYLHQHGPRQLLGVLLCALIAPTTIWYLFSQILTITLP